MKTLLPTRIPSFDEAIYAFNSFTYKKDKTMMKYILREWIRKVKRIVNRLEIMQEKVLNNSTLIMDKHFVNENMIMWAFRYALGRRTGAATDVVDWLMGNWETLKPFTRNQIQEEIRDAFRVDKAGDHCDIIQWQKILNIVEI